MSSKNKVRKLAGIRESLIGVIKAIDKMQLSSAPDEPKENKMNGTVKIGNDFELEFVYDGYKHLEFDGNGIRPSNWYYGHMWQTHKATKVVETGYFCPDCGGVIGGVNGYVSDGSRHVCWRRHGIMPNSERASRCIK